MTLKEIRVPGVQPVKQGDQELLVFVVSAKTLLDIGAVLRFDDHPMGVNRALVYNRVKQIAAGMKSGKVRILRDPIMGSLYGSDGVEWVYDRKSKTLIGYVETDKDNRTDGCFLAIDDGQHRYSAMEILGGDIIATWQFTVIAGLEMERETRIELFIQGEERKRVSPRLVLSMQDAMGAFGDEKTATAYGAARLLNTASASPLKGKIYFDQHAKVPKGMVNVTSLMGTLRYVVGAKSRLRPLTREEQKTAILNLFVAASEQWSTHWGQSDKTLGKRIGYLALLTLIAKGGNFHSRLAGRHDLDSFRAAFRFARGFRWEQPGVKEGKLNHNSLAGMLDEYIGVQIAASEVGERDAS